MSACVDITGIRYGSLVVIRYSHSKNGTYWHCKCDCGNFTVAPKRSLNYGTTKSCGCGSKDQARRNLREHHGKIRLPYQHSRKLKDLYNNLLDRCYNETNKRWANYGGRGIVVCDEWKNSRRTFYKWANENGHEPGLQIDRIDVNGNYEPNNCRFVNAIVQMNNTTRNHWIEWHGKRMTIAEWSRNIGISGRIIQARIARGWTIERAMTQPPRRSRRQNNHD